MVRAAAVGLPFAAAGDAGVEEAAPRRNRGQARDLWVDGGADPDVWSYLRFDVAGVSGPVTRATLRLYALDIGATADGPQVFLADNRWDENTITWNTRPPYLGLPADDAGSMAANGWAELDVTALVAGDGTYTFALVPESADGAGFASREGTNPPQLVVETDASGGMPDPPSSDEGAVLLAAGDIASCTSTGDDKTAALLDSLDGSVAALGDLAYVSGTTAEFANCYHPTWGQHRARTRPALGNHDIKTNAGGPYHDYFGDAAGPRGKGWYAYDLGAWRVVVLNSNCAIVSCAAGSEQERWLRAELAGREESCTLAYWHHPRFSSGTAHGSNPAVQPFWQAMVDLDVDVVLNGHEHNYERFAPMDAAGTADPSGPRAFVVGTGGNTLYGFGTVLPTSEARNDDTRGVLKLTLDPGGYDWAFVPEAGKSFTDTGSGTC